MGAGFFICLRGLPEPVHSRFGIYHQQHDQADNDGYPAVRQAEEAEHDVDHHEHADDGVGSCRTHHGHLGEPEVNQAKED